MLFKSCQVREMSLSSSEWIQLKGGVGSKKLRPESNLLVEKVLYAAQRTRRSQSRVKVLRLSMILALLIRKYGVSRKCIAEYSWDTWARWLSENCKCIKHVAHVGKETYISVEGLDDDDADELELDEDEIGIPPSMTDDDVLVAYQEQFGWEKNSGTPTAKKTDDEKLAILAGKQQVLKVVFQNVIDNYPQNTPVGSILHMFRDMEHLYKVIASQDVVVLREGNLEVVRDDALSASSSLFKQKMAAEYEMRDVEEFLLYKLRRVELHLVSKSIGLSKEKLLAMADNHPYRFKISIHKNDCGVAVMWMSARGLRAHTYSLIKSSRYEEDLSLW